MKVCTVCHRCFDDTVFSCIEHNDTELSSIQDRDPEMIAGYRLEQLLDRDRLTESYLARHTNSDRECLIKIIAGNGDRREPFLRDAEMASSLFDPNIANIYETGALENGDIYLVAEQLLGRSLRDILIERGTVELLTAVSIIRQAAEAVHALHLKGIIHRAIRPENIIVSDDNVVRLTDTDFGGLIEHSIVSDKFTIDAAVNVLRYFAPEQFSDNGTTLKADVYSLGVVFYEMLTGRPPFEAEAAAGLIEMHRTQRPDDVTIDDFDLRMLITHTLMESLNKHPENRQSSANAFARQLRHVEQLATHVSTPPPVVRVPIPIRTVEVAAKAPATPVINKHVDIDRIPVVEPPVPEVINTAAPSISHDVVAEHAAQPPESRLNQFRRRLKRHRHEHVVDSAQQDILIENSVSEPVDDLPEAVSVEIPLQEIEVEAPVQAKPTKPEQPVTDEEIYQPAEIPEPICAPVIRQPRGIVITNPRKLGLRETFSTPPPNAAHHEPDEITAVTARSRTIRVPVDDPKPQGSHAVARSVGTTASVDNWFFPTLFGGSTATANEKSSMFSGFYGDATDRGLLVPRVIKVGGLVVAIASLILIGKQFTGELRSEAALVKTDPTRSVSAPAQQPLAEVQNLPQRISETSLVNSPATSEKISQPLATVKSPTDARPPKSRSTLSEDEPSSAVEATRSKSDPKSLISKPTKADTAKTSSSSQPLARAAKADPKPQSLTRNTNKPIAQNKPGATTRPRIVANPRP